MAFGLRAMLAIVLPSAVGLLVLAHPLINFVLLHGAEAPAQADQTGAALAMFALGLPGFCTFLYMIRVFQAMQDTRTAFRIYLVENALNVLFGVALVEPLGVRGLALSVSIAYSVAAVMATSVVRSRVGGLGGDDLTVPLRRVLLASAVMAVATVLAVNVSGSSSTAGLFLRLAFAVVVGGAAYLGTVVLLGARDARRAAPSPPPAPGRSGEPGHGPGGGPSSSGSYGGGPSIADRSEDSPAASGDPTPTGPGADDRTGATRGPVLDADTVPEPFRGRLDGQAVPPVRLLGPVQKAVPHQEREEEADGEDQDRHR